MPISGVSALAQAAMVAYCGWDPTTPVVNGTVKLDGNGSRSAFLPSLYVTAVASVVVTLPDGSTFTCQIGEGLDVSWGANGELRLLPTSSMPFIYWPDGKANIAVTFSGGYSTPPDDLMAALQSVNNRLTQGSAGLTGAKIGTASMTYAAAVAAGGLLNVEQWVFDSYRIIKASA